MRHRPKLQSRCKPTRKPFGPCPKPTGKGETLADLIREYKRDQRDRQQAGRARYRGFASLSEAIKHAAGSVGWVPDHQRRVGRETLKSACDRLLRHEEEIDACKSFDQLLDVVERHTEDIYRFGKLAVYDTACRLGVFLDLAPDVVYLHAGTAEGARALGLNTKRGYLTMDGLPEPFRSLEPWECEDFLCIYKARLAALKPRPFFGARD